MTQLIQDFETVVLVDGTFPSHRLPLSVLSRAKRIICCDGATVGLLAYGLTPDYIVGDMDSLSDELTERFKGIIRKNPDQETNDMTKAVQFCLENAWTEITILGATGKREDHTLGNLSLLADYEGVNVQMLTDHGVFLSQSSNMVYASFPGEQISIFSLTPDTRITTQGLRYAVKDRLFTSWWQGTLNEASGNSFEIIIDRGKLLVFRQYE